MNYYKFHKNRNSLKLIDLLLSNLNRLYVALKWRHLVLIFDRMRKII